MSIPVNFIGPPQILQVNVTYGQRYEALIAKKRCK